MSLPDLHTLWIGPRLTWLERLSLCSCLANGHHVILWCYELIEGVPDGVQLADAQAILPKSSITYHRESGSVTYFANRFRYHLLRRQPATWLDAGAEFSLDYVVEPVERKQVGLEPSHQCGPGVSAHVGRMPSSAFKNIIACYQDNRFSHACLCRSEKRTFAHLNPDP